MKETAQQWTLVDGLRVAFRRAGSGPALVLIHGLLGYSFSWRSAIPFLSEDREVFAVDMPGAGLSECSPKLDCRLAAAAKRLLGFMDAVGIRSCDLVGSSYGGATAMMAAAFARSRVRTLGLVSPANPWSNIGRMRLALLKVPLVASLFPEAGRSFPMLYRYSVRNMYGDGDLVTEETLQGYGVPLARKGVLEHAVRITQTWHSDMKELEAALPRISDVPALLVWGSKDRVVDLRSAARLARQFHDAERAIINGAGHLPYEERPDEFSRILLKFLDRRSPVGPSRK